MNESQEETIERVTSSPLFPFEGEFTLKPRHDLMVTEVQREGEGDRPCESCGDDTRMLWRNDRWKLTSIRPSANPVGLFLETIDHIDFEDFDDEYATELGVLTVRLEAAIRSIDAVGRVHIHRWGDGSSHFHMWFQGRPARQLELYGWGNILWAQVLEPLPAEVIAGHHDDVVDQILDLGRRL